MSALFFKPQIVPNQTVIDEIGWIKTIRIDHPFLVSDHKQLGLKSGSVYGIHFQLPELEQNKIVSVLRGITFHVAIEMIRGEIHQFQLTDGQTLFVPKGWAHGTFALQDSLIHLAVDNPFSDLHARGIGWNKLKLEWIDKRDVFPEHYTNQDDKWPDFETARQEYTDWTLKKSTTNL